MRRFSIVENFGFVANLLYRYIPKFLDFTDYRLTKSELYKLQKEVLHLQNRILFKDEIEDWYFKIANIIRPVNFNDLQVVRVGSEFDGGYFVPVVQNLPKSWLSIGLGYNVEFENYLIKQGNTVNAFDHTIKSRPKKLSKLVNLHKVGWGPSTGNTNSLNGLLTMTGYNQEWCLKFDIESSEWNLLHEISSLVKKPAIILCEFHDIYWEEDGKSNAKKIKALKNLLLEYHVVHINGNNFSPEIITENVTINSVIEMTLVKKDFLDYIPNTIKPVSEINIINHVNNPKQNPSRFRIKY